MLIDAVLAEFIQLSGYTSFDGLDPNKMTPKQKRMDLNLITKIKKKRCGKIKGRACAEERKQRVFIKKEDVTSPTVQLEAFILSLLQT